MLAKIKKSLTEFFLPCEGNGGRAKIFSSHFLVVLILTLAFLKIGFAAFLYYFPDNALFADITKSAIIQLTNDERAKNNLAPLSQNPILDKAAYLKAQDMLKNGYFNHTSPAGTDPWHWFRAAGYLYRYAGENLAIGFVDSGEVNNAWMESPTHRANIVNNKYREIGIAVVNGNFQGNPATVVVQLFGNRQGIASTAPLAQTKTAVKPTIAATDSSKNLSLIANKKVMGATDTTVEEPNSIRAKLILFFNEYFFNMIQWLTYGSLLFVGILLIINFIIRPDLKHADLLAKAIGFMVVAAVFTLIDQNLTVALIPHDLQIY